MALNSGYKYFDYTNLIKDIYQRHENNYLYGISNSDNLLSSICSNSSSYYQRQFSLIISINLNSRSKSFNILFESYKKYLEIQIFEMQKNVNFFHYLRATGVTNWAHSSNANIMLGDILKYTKGNYMDISLPMCSSGLVDGQTLSYVMSFQDSINGL